MENDMGYPVSESAMYASLITAIGVVSDESDPDGQRELSLFVFNALGQMLMPTEIYTDKEFLMARALLIGGILADNFTMIARIMNLPKNSKYNQIIDEVARQDKEPIRNDLVDTLARTALELGYNLRDAYQEVEKLQDYVASMGLYDRH